MTTHVDHVTMTSLSINSTLMWGTVYVLTLFSFATYKLTPTNFKSTLKEDIYYMATKTYHNHVYVSSNFLFIYIYINIFCLLFSSIKCSNHMKPFLYVTLRIIDGAA